MNKKYGERTTDLYERMAEMHELHDEEDIFKLVLTSIEEILNYRMALIYRAINDRLKVIHNSKGIPEEGGVDMSINEGIAGKTFRKQKAYKSDDISRLEEARPSSDKYRSGLSFPLGEDCVLQIMSEKKNYFSDVDFNLVRILTLHASAALKRINFESEIRRERKEYKHLFESANDAIFLMRGDKFIDCNRRALEMFDCEREQFIGNNPYEDLSPDIQPDGRDSKEKALEKIEKAVNGNPQRFEWVHRKCSGSTFFTEVSLNAVEIEGEILILALVRDISRRKQVEENLRESEREFRNIFHHSPVGIYRTTPDGEILMVNQTLVDMLGFESEEELKKYNLEEDAPLSDYPREKFKKIVEEQEVVKGLKNKWYRKDCSPLYIRESAMAVRDSEGNIKFYEGTVEDITEEVKIREELRESRRTLRTLMSNLPGMAYRCRNDKDWTMEFISEGCKELTGYDPEEIINNDKISYNEIIHPDDREYVWNEVQKSTGRGNYFRIIYRIKNREGDLKWVWEKGRGIFDENGDIKFLEGFITDITERKKLEKELEKSKDFYQSIYDTTIAISEEEGLEKTIKVIADRATQLLNARDAAVYLLNQDRRILEPFYSNAPENREEIMSFDIELGEGLTGTVAETGEADFLNYDGDEDYSIHVPDTDSEEDKHESIISVPLFDEDSVTGVITLSRFREKFDRKDVEKLSIFARQAEQAIKKARYLEELHESEERYRTLIEETYNGVYIYRNEEILFANEMLFDLTGYSEEELYSMNIFNLVAPEDRERVKNITRERRKKGDRSTYTDEAVIITKEGERRICRITAKGIKYRGKSAIMGVVRDITEFRRMEEELRKGEKLESLGVLAGGIAHDFNNLLTGIIGNISMIKAKTDESETEEILKEAENACRQAKNLTQQLLTFSSGGSPVTETESIVEIIKDSADFALRGSNVEPEYNFSDDLWKVEVDKGQMSQVIHNIMINADQAMPEGGKVELSGENFMKKESHNIPLDNGRYVKISIVDTGTGINEEHLKKIFDPYFTTKQKGSGLGLATVYSIMKNHGGHVMVESEVGEGTTFYLYIPATEKERKESDEKMESIGKAFKEMRGKVLLMDDEKVIRDVAEKMLQKINCEVELAEDGEEVIEKYKEHDDRGEPFDCVIVDLTVPGGMGGKETVRELKKIFPDARVIVSSGYSDDPVMSSFEKYGFCDVIPKPYEIEQLSRVLKRAISEKEE